MKKIVMLIMVVLGIMLTGCGKDEAKENILYVGTNAEYKPYEYLDGDKIVGFDIDLMEEIGKSMGYKVEWINMSFDGLLPALQSGKIDMVIAGMTPTEERAKAVDFSDVYYSSAQAILVNKDSDVVIANEEDLKGKVVGVQMGTIQEKIANELGAKEVKAYNSFTGGILDLNQDKIDCVVVADVVAAPYLKSNPNLAKATTIGKEGTADGSAIAMPKGSDELVAKINAEIDKLKENGKYQELVNKYF